MNIDNSRVSAKLSEVREKLRYNLAERLNADEAGEYDLSLQIQNGFLGGQQSILQQIQEGQFEARSRDTESEASTGRA